MNSRKKVLILDGFALIFRAFYAFIRNPLKTSKGEPTSAIFGFVRMLIKLLKDYQPDYFVVALDSPTKTFRHSIYKEYKANRSEAPDDLKTQIPIIIDLIGKFQLATLRKDGYEADDIIGTLCEKYKNDNNLDVLVVTGDKDILQLVEGNVKVITTSKGVSEVVEYDRDKVHEKWGVYPEKIVDLFALMGDSSDNIPGVKGVGPKAATKLLNQYISVEDVYSNLDQITKKKLKENLLNSQSNALLSKELVTIERQVPIEYDIEDFANTNIAQDSAIQMLKQYELNGILKDEIFSNGMPPDSLSQQSDGKDKTPPSAPKGEYKGIFTKKDLEELIRDIKKAKFVSIDLETTSENPMIAEIIGVAFSTEPQKGYFLPIPMKTEDSDLFSEEKGIWDNDLKDYNLDKAYVIQQLKGLCEDLRIHKIGQNIKYDYMILKRTWDIEIKSIVFDTMIASYLLNPGRKSHGMDYLAEELLEYQTVHYKDIVGKGQTLLNIPLHSVIHYASEDTDITLQLYNIFKPQIDQSAFKDLYYDIELPLVTVLGEMELNGVQIDPDHFKTMSLEIKDRLDYLRKEIWELSGGEFNINSTQQLSEILFTKLGLTPIKKTKTGYSTDVFVLEKLAEEHQVPLHLLEYRRLTKLKSAYLDSIPKLIDPVTQRVHTSFNQTVAQTGRLSSNKPNMQNIPIKDKIGRAIRKGFIARPDFYIMSADYSQIELRILAHMSQDPNLIKAYKENIDIHTQTAALIFRKDTSKISQDERRIAKTINFSVIYGIGAVALGKDLKVSTKKAKEFIDNYFKEYAGVTQYIDQQKSLAHEKGYVETLYRRIRYLPEIMSSNKREQSMGERLAVNTPIQGTSADLIKIAMVNIDREMTKRSLKSLMTIQVHDELVFEVHKDELEVMKKLVVEKMETAAKLSVPLEVSISYGQNWDEAH